MGTSLSAASLADVRAIIAQALCGHDASPRAVGDVTLTAAQRECVRRAHAAIAEFGGVLVASDVGSGKTFIALALASAYAQPVILAPAALRTMWSAALARAHAAMPFVSLESLGRGRAPASGHDIVIIDEAHHLRNSGTRTYRAARRSTAGARVVLLSATPVHNRRADLDALLALFLTGDPRDLTEESRSRMIVRSAHAAAGPHVVIHPRTTIPESARVIAGINALPPPIAVRDGGIAVALGRLSLLRAWASSVGAFAAMVRRATLRAAALSDALRAGRHPTQAELRAFSDDGQLAFAELISAGVPVDTSSLAQLDAHLDGLSFLRDLAQPLRPLDDERARQLGGIATAHRGVAVLSCTQYAATVDAYWHRLHVHAGVAALTSRGARIASGPISRDDALARFAPMAQGARPPRDHERIHLLIATDLVSEGVNLHDAGVVVHLDVPWTAARLAQRVGRLARMGSPHDAIHTYELAPPHAAAAALALFTRLRNKRRLATRLIGSDRRFAELLGDTGPNFESAAEARASMIRAATPFAGAAPAYVANPVVCAINAASAGWLALVGHPDAPQSGRVVAQPPGETPTTDPRSIAPLLKQLTLAVERVAEPAAVAEAVRDVERWLSHQRAHRLAGVGRRHAARARGAVLARSVGAVSAAPSHERARAAAGAAASFVPHTVGQAPESLLALVVFCTDGIPARRSAV